MKKQGLQIVSLCLFATLALSSAPAQSRITVKVPFAFNVSDQSFPAGQYSLFSWRDHLTLQNSTGAAVFFGIVNSVSGRHVSERGEVIFHCYEERCFLSELWVPTRENGSQLLLSKTEKEWAKNRKLKANDFALLEVSGKQ